MMTFFIVRARCQEEHHILDVTMILARLVPCDLLFKFECVLSAISKKKKKKVPVKVAVACLGSSTLKIFTVLSLEHVAIRFE